MVCVIVQIPGHYTFFKHNISFPIYFQTETKLARQLGIQPDAVETLPDVHGDIQASVDELFPSGTSPNASSSTAMPSTAQRVSETLRGVSHESNGSIGYRYTASSLLACLKIASHVKSSSKLSDVLSDVAALMLGSGSDQLQADLRSGTVHLPGLTTLRTCRVKLDLCNMLFERKLFLDYQYIRFICPDSSPQLGYNFLICREERIRIPRCGDPVVMLATMNLSANYESRVFSLSCIGARNAKLAKKNINIANTMLMESSDDKAFHATRNEVRGGVSDQGTEFAIGEETVKSVPRFAHAAFADASQLYLFPLCLWLPGHLHILYNALKEAVESVPGWADYMSELRTVQEFLSDKSLRGSFQFHCCPPDMRHLFDSYSTTHIDWKWEMLGKALTKLVPLIQPLARFIDTARILNTGRVLTAGHLVQLVEHIFKNEPAFAEVSELLRVMGAVVEHYAKQLETCWCHEDTWLQRKSHASRKRDFVASTGSQQCVWKGRMGPWWVAVGIHEMFAELTSCRSVVLDQMLADAIPKTRQMIVAQLQLLRLRLIEVLKEKLGFWKYIPYKALGIFYCCCGGSVVISKRIYHECRAEYDEATRLCKTIHRIANELFSKSSNCRKELDQWYDSDAPLTSFRFGHSTVLVYALCSLVERATEGVHAIIKRIGREAPYILPPYVCAKLRESYNLSLLRSSPAFEAFCKAQWRMPREISHMPYIITSHMSHVTLVSTHQSRVSQKGCVCSFLDT